MRIDMKTRLVRAGIASLVFGFLCSLLPYDGSVMAASGTCTGGTSSSTAAYVIGGAAAGGLLIGNAGGGLFPYVGARRKKTSYYPYQKPGQIGQTDTYQAVSGKFNGKLEAAYNPVSITDYSNLSKFVYDR